MLFVLRDHEINDAPANHVNPGVLVRDYGGPLRSEGVVAFCMVEVPVGVYRVIHSFTADI